MLCRSSLQSIMSCMGMPSICIQISHLGERAEELLQIGLEVPGLAKVDK